MSSKEWIDSTNPEVTLEISQDDNGIIRYEITDGNFGAFDIGGHSPVFVATERQNIEIAEFIVQLKGGYIEW